MALLVLVVVALGAALLLDTALQGLRVARGGAAWSRAQSAVESALAATLASSVDSAGASLNPGVVRDSLWGVAGDSTFLRVQSLGGRLRRVVVRSTVAGGGARAIAGAVAYLRVEADSTPAGWRRRLRPVPGWWWAPLP